MSPFIIHLFLTYFKEYYENNDRRQCHLKTQCKQAATMYKYSVLILLINTLILTNA